MSRIVEFLEARFAEDEAIANAATGDSWHWRPEDDSDDQDHGPWLVSDRMVEMRGGGSYPDNVLSTWIIGAWGGLSVSDEDQVHVARHDPARILREVAVKRAIVKAYEDADIRAHDTYGGYEDILNGESNGLERALELLTATYSDHPDFDPDWPL